MKTKYFFMIASAGILAGIISVFVYDQKIKSQEPLSTSYNPYTSGIYASGIVESFQKNGTNVNIFPEMEGNVINVLVKDGDRVKKNDLLLEISHEQEKSLLKKSQSTAAAEKANLVSLQEQYKKLKKAHQINSKAVSLNELDISKNAVAAAKQTLRAAKAQVEVNQGNIDNYYVRAPSDGIIMRIVPAVGDYISPVVGVYDPNTQSNLPVIQMAHDSPYYQVRVYVDEILTPQLPNMNDIEATLFVRGLKNESIPLTFVNLQPYTIPNIHLSDQRNLRVDVRVLPIIFKFEKPKDINIFPGQLVDVYIRAKS